VTVRFRGRVQRALARDTLGFLAGQRPVPLAADYRRKWWMLWAALIFALGLAGGPLVLSQTADLGLEFGLKVGAGFALVGLIANAAVALFSRWSAPSQLAAMAVVCALVTGVFLFGATAYLAGRQKAIEETRPAPPPDPGGANPNPGQPNPNPNPGPQGAPSHVDRAFANPGGFSALDDGPADVTALTIAPDNNTLGIGYADGTTNLCLLDQPTFDSILPGPKADGPVTRVRFDTSGRFVFALTPTGAVGTTRTGPFVAFAKVPGSPIAIAPDLVGDRVRYAAVRGNTIQHRTLATAFIQRPPAKAKDMGVSYALPGKGDEVVPPGSGPDQPKPGGGPGPTFLAWTPGGKLFAGQPDGSIAIWSNAMRPEAPSRDHKAAVRVWADCSTTGDFVTGDDQGHIVWWPYKGGKPTVWTIAEKTPITALAFSPSGARLMIADAAGWLTLWDVADGRALRSAKRPAPVKVMAFGPADDVLILGRGKSVEVWWVPRLLE
jgi:hypothetical protein